MKNSFYTFILIFILSTVNFAQSKSIEDIQIQIKKLNAEKNILLEFDKAAGYAKLMLLCDGFGSEQNRKNGLASFTFGMKYDFDAREIRSSPQIFFLTFWVKGKNTTFAENHAWKARIDGEIVVINDGRYARKKGDEREFLNFVVSRSNLEKIAGGGKVTFQIGTAEFEVSAEIRQMFANFLRVSTP